MLTFLENCYMPVDCQRPSKSYDFGENGHTGSITTWHELLQLTAPDDRHGVVYVRGDFPDNTNSILARAQRRNPTGTFGLGVYVDKQLEPGQVPTVLEQTSAHGLINMRWPCTRLNYVQNDEHRQPVIVADYTACSFVKDRIVYQVVHISPRGPSSPGSIKDGARPLPLVNIKVNIGGLIRFGSAECLFADDLTHWPLYDTYSPQRPEDDHCPYYTLACQSERLMRRLEMRLWINREPINLREATIEYDSNNRLKYPRSGTGGTHNDDIVALRAEVPAGIAQSPINIIAAFSLVPADQDVHFGKTPAITNWEVRDHLGVSPSSLSAPYRLWSYITHEPPGLEAQQLNAIGRCTEAILGVSVVPVPIPRSQDALRERESLSVVREPRSSKSPAIALIKNIMSAQVVDFENAL